MARLILSYDELMSKIVGFKEAGLIWNQEREALKDQVNSAFQVAMKPFTYDNDEFMEAVRAEPRDQFLQEMYYAHPDTALRASTYIKKIKAAEKKFGLSPLAKPFAEAALAAAEPWVALSAEFEALKPLIKKGRQPDPDRKTPVRTIENTGTCAICEMNVKMKDGKLVHHGYQVKWSSFVGDCFGVGYQPVEVSKVALEDYIVALNTTLEIKAVSLKELKDGTETGLRELPLFNQTARTLRQNGETVRESYVWKDMEVLKAGEYDRVAASMISGMEGEMRMIKASLDYVVKKLAKWAPKKLPGE